MSKSPHEYTHLDGSAVVADDVAAKVDEMIKENPIIIFSKTTCQFCFEMKRTLASHGVKFAVFEINESEHTGAIQDHLQSISDIRTVPNTFINGKSIGGCLKAKEMEMDGSLQIMLAPYVGEVPYVKPKISGLGLLWFPDTTNGVVVRFGGAISSIYALFCCIFMFRPATRWACLALAFDYILRFVFGATHSPIGILAMVCGSKFKPTFKPGPPKNFATGCGVFFSLFAAILVLIGQPIGAIVVLGMLVCAAGMEGFFDFCVGCVFFGIAIKLGLCPHSVYRPHLNLAQNRRWGWEFAHSAETFPEAERQHVLEAGQTEETPVDLIRKDRLETEYKQKDFHLIKHARNDLYAMTLTLSALAYIFQITTNHYNKRQPGTDWRNFGTGIAARVLWVTAIILTGVFLVLHIARFVLYRKKVVKEFFHPVFGNMWAALFISFTIWGIMRLDADEQQGKALIWTGSVLQALLSVSKVADLLYNRIAPENITPAIMMGPVGNYVSALGFATVYWFYRDNKNETDYLQTAQLWFGVASLFTVVFFVATFQKAMSDHHSDARTRFLNWIWLATFSIAGPAYQYCSGNGPDYIYQSLWCISFFLFAVLGLGWLNGHFSYMNDMVIWVMPFSMAAFTLSTYSHNVGDTLMWKDLLIIITAITCTSTAACFLHTMNSLFEGTLFQPRPKWGPANFMKLTHEMFRYAIPKMAVALEALKDTDALAIEKFLGDVDCMFAAFMEHSRHEDFVLFPAVRRFFPRMGEEADEEHHSAHAQVHEMEDMIKQYREATKDSNKSPAEAAATLLKGMLPVFKAWGTDVLPHLRHEEASFTVVVRKYFPIEMQIQATKEVYQLTPAAQWAKILPFTVANLPSPVWKVRYIKTFLWADPTIAQQIGLQLYRGLDTIEWLLIAQEIPECIPRGLPNWKRIY